MTIRTLLIISLTLSAPLFGLCEGVSFSSLKWKDVLTQAQQEEKMIFVDLITEWCSPCKQMSREVFPNDTVGSYFNSHFISLKVDAENDSLGAWLRKDLAITGYPTLLFFDASGKPLHRWAGSRNVSQMVNLGKDAHDPAKQFYTIKNNWEASKDDPERLLEYMIVASHAGVSIKEPIQQYESLTSPQDWMKKENWDRLVNLDIPYESELYAHSSKNREKYGLAPDSPLHNGLQTFYFLRKQFCKEEDKPAVIAAIKYAHDGHLEELALAEFEMLWMRRHKPDSSWSATVNYLDNYCYVDYYWGKVATDIARNENATQEELEKSLEWINQAIELNNFYNHVATKALLTYKLGDERQAKSLAHEAIELADQEFKDHTSMNELLGKMGE